VIALAYGGRVTRLPTARAEQRTVRPRAPSRLCAGQPFEACFHHGDCVAEAPAGFDVVAEGGDLGVEVMESEALLRFGVQYHPERGADADPTLWRFLHFCETRRAAAASPLPAPVAAPVAAALALPGEEADGIAVSWTTARHVEWMLGRTHPAALAAQHSLSRAGVELLWRRFRARFRIPAVLL
jgi:hypothetical protein